MSVSNSRKSKSNTCDQYIIKAITLARISGSSLDTYPYNNNVQPSVAVSQHGVTFELCTRGERRELGLTPQPNSPAQLIPKQHEQTGQKDNKCGVTSTVLLQKKLDWLFYPGTMADYHRIN